MIIQLVTTWNTPCGIAEHGMMLKEAVEAADPDIQVSPCPEYLDPARVQRQNLQPPLPILHLNYQASLHARWTPSEVANLQRRGYKVIITYHDTYDGTASPNSDQAKALCDLADAFVVHEPVTDLPRAIYWRQGVPGWHEPSFFGRRSAWNPTDAFCFKASSQQPVLGSLGFPFPWKNYDLLCTAAALAGWAVLLIAPGATEEQVAGWHARCPDLWVRTDFVPRAGALSLLSGCDATAFLYVNHNTGTSAAIRMGLAARKPVLAIHPDCGGRQFRDLVEEALYWITDGSPQGIADMFACLPIASVDPFVVRLAHQDSWTQRGRDYAALYHRIGASA